ncbi:hypothetical protein QPK87_37435 [Kamptonema cortianum]|nr:hypothetical protein [Kamptonema cortianum]
MSAAQMYAATLGMSAASGSSQMELAAGVFHFFIDPGKPHAPVLELLTNDLAKARAAARSLAMEEVVWKGVGKLNLLVDPFGVRWNVYEEASELADIDADFEESEVIPKLAIHAPELSRAADFYATIFELSHFQTPSGYVMDHGTIQLSIEEGLPIGPAFYVSSSEVLERLGAAPGRKIFTDAFGVTWKCQNLASFHTAVTVTE